MEKFTSVVELVKQLKPTEPVYCIRRKSIKISSKYFKDKFPGKILYAVKTNPSEFILKKICLRTKWLFVWGQEPFQIGSEKLAMN